ncbi:hypothetical protein HQQ81_11120 [Microbacteriaceae bacterium VKM Ac-2854]|nr:hypothetical protein [Microbacteriaceae bacterium VKM Ac-2854]
MIDLILRPVRHTDIDLFEAGFSSESGASEFQGFGIFDYRAVRRDLDERGLLGGSANTFSHSKAGSGERNGAQAPGMTSFCTRSCAGSGRCEAIEPTTPNGHRRTSIVGRTSRNERCRTNAVELSRCGLGMSGFCAAGQPVGLSRCGMDSWSGFLLGSSVSLLSG